MASVSTDDLIAMFREPVESNGLDLEDVEVRQVGSRTQIRVAVDKDGGVDLDQVTDISRLLSEVLDANESILPESYVLEVGSPGVDRPLTEPRHWRRAIGRLVSINLVDNSVVSGRVVSTTEDAVTLTIKTGELDVPLSNVRRAIVEVELNPPKADA